MMMKFVIKFPETFRGNLRKFRNSQPQSHLVTAVEATWLVLGGGAKQQQQQQQQLQRPHLLDSAADKTQKLRRRRRRR